MKKSIIAVLFLCIFVTSCGSGTSENSQERLKAKAHHLQLVLFSELKGADGGAPLEGDSVLFNEDDILLDGSSVESAQAEEQKNTENEIINTVKLTFSEEGSIQFARITSNHIGERLAIIVDGKLLSALVIQTEINDGICIISGGFTKQAAESFAALFND